MFRETTVHKWDFVTIHSHLLNTIPRTLNTRYYLYWTSRDHKLHHKLFCTTESERLPGIPPSWKILYQNLLCRTNLLIKSVSEMDGASCMLSGSTISSNFGKYIVITDAKNFIAASENALGISTTIKPDFTFRKMAFFIVWPASSTRILPWCPSLQNQQNDLFKNNVPANS